MLNLLFLFTVVPAFELYLLIQVGEQIGALETISIIIVTGVVGAHFARSQGFSILARIQSEMAQGALPGNSIIEGLMVLVGGILLITPGFITDAFGLSLVLPLTRKLFIGLFKRQLEKRARSGKMFFYTNVNGQEWSSHQPAWRDVTPDSAEQFPPQQTIIDIDKKK